MNLRDRFRLFALVAMLLFVLAAMRMTARPQFWYWMFPEERRAAQPAPAAIPEEGQLGTSQPSTPATAIDRATDSGIDAIQPHPEIPTEWLDAIRDDLVSIRASEREPMFNILAMLGDDREPYRSTASVVPFSVLMENASLYRGRLIEIEGEAHRVSQFSAGDNQHGFDELYEAWVWTRDSGTNPYRLVISEIPSGITIGESLERPLRVRATAIFFKREGYEAQHGFHVAPVLLARSITVMPDPRTVSVFVLTPVEKGVLLMMTTLIVVSGLMMWRDRRRGSGVAARIQRGNDQTESSRDISAELAKLSQQLNASDDEPNSDKSDP